MSGKQEGFGMLNTLMCTYCGRHFPIEEMRTIDDGRLVRSYCSNHYDEVKTFVDQQKRKAEEYFKRNPETLKMALDVFKGK